MDLPAMDAIDCDGQQQSCEWRAFIVRDKRRLAVEFVYFGFEIAAAGGRGSECSDLPRANQRRLKIAKSSGSPPFGAAIRNHRRVFGENRYECVSVSCTVTA